MSLIHDALKKAQQEARSHSSSATGKETIQTPDSIDEIRPPIPKRPIILGGIFVVVLGVFLYFTLRPPGKSAPTSAATTPQVTQQSEEVELGRLKRQGVELFHAENYDDAKSKLEMAGRIDPQDPEIWNNLGLVEKERGNLSAAQKNYEKALELKPDFPQALNNLAVVQMQTGEETQGQKNLERSLELDAAYPEAYFNLALLTEQQGDKEKAIEYYKRFLKVGKSQPAHIIDQVRDHVIQLED